MIKLSELKTLTVERSWDIYNDISDEYVKKNKRHRDNYLPETRQQLLEQNYFNCGAYGILANDQPIAAFGLYSYRDWIFMARFVCNHNTDIPLFYPMHHEAMKHSSKGIIMTVNRSNLGLRKIFQQRKNYCGTNVFILSDRMSIMKFSWLEQSVWYRNTEQWAFYQGQNPQKLFE